MPLDLIACEDFALISKKGDVMPNLLTQDVHTYITELLAETIGPEEVHEEPSQSRLSADSGAKRKPTDAADYHHTDPVHSTKIGG